MADLPRESTRLHTLLRIDDRPISDDRNEIRAFMTVRDEMLRLRQNLTHHRSIGVGRFLVVDNGSTDGSREFLLAQPDCHVFLTCNSYADSRYGLECQEALLDEYGTNWCLIVDADEWFIYPGYERKPLPDLAAYLDRNDVQGIFSFLLDMYGPGTIAEAVAASRRSLLDVCRYFDSQYFWRRRLRIPGLQGTHFPNTTSPAARDGACFFRCCINTITCSESSGTSVRRSDFRCRHRGGEPPFLTKIPFVRWPPGTRYAGPHATTPIWLSEITGVLLDFKFLEDFFARVNFRARKYRDDSESALGRCQRICTISGRTQGEPIPELPLSGQRRV
jgi:glycosyltransferase involved in cell wall biosynthesis